jgi:hypothetical protein
VLFCGASPALARNLLRSDWLARDLQEAIEL